MVAFGHQGSEPGAFERPTDLDIGPDAVDRPGDPVTLWGDGLPVNEIAACADTISYQLLCGLTPRVAVDVC